MDFGVSFSFIRSIDVRKFKFWIPRTMLNIISMNYLPGKSSIANIARERLFASVGPDVGRQMIRSREGSGTDGTLERPDTCVNSQMSRELIRS